MYHHVKKLMLTVRIDEPDPCLATCSAVRWANGELAAEMQYSIQGLNCEDPDREGLLMDIGRGTEPCRSEVNPCPRLIL